LNFSASRPSLIQPFRSQSGGQRGLSLTFIWSDSIHLRCPAPLPGQVVGPALAAVGEVRAVGDHSLCSRQVSSGMQLAAA
jgi:hypothetical protein